MKFLPFYILFFLSILGVNSLKGQDIRKEFDAVYNMDPELYNGQVFSGIYRTKVKGNPFFYDESFSEEDLSLLNKTYSKQELNYDVFHQKILLSFEDKNKASKVIEIPLQNIRSFSFHTKYFELLPWGNEGIRIFQVFTFKEQKLLIYWSKSLKTNASDGSQYRQFSSLKKRIWLLVDNEYITLKNNKTLIEIYPSEQQILIKDWLKSRKIKISKADDADLKRLVNYLNEI